MVVKSGFHYVGYAYPTSTMASRLNRAKDGCWFLRVEGRPDAGFSSRENAVAAAAAAGTKPDRWSVDHPANAR